MATQITSIYAPDFMSQEYNPSDINLITSYPTPTYLNSGSYIENFIYDNNKNILYSSYNFTAYTILNDGQLAQSNDVSQIEIDPEKSLIDQGFDQGQYVTYFNFLNKKIGSELLPLYISEISPDRTEIRLDSTTLSDLDILEQTNNFIREREDSLYFVDFYLNFGDNQLIISNNIKIDAVNNNPTILVKLYEPLPSGFDINSTLWIVTTFEEPTAYQVTFEDPQITFSDSIPIKGPNFNLDIKDRINNSTQALSYQDILSTSINASSQQIHSLLEEKEIDINVDYTNFSNFIHFSSAKTRIQNFYYKLQLIEQYESAIETLNITTNNNPSASIAIYESKINNIITNFDGYDYYLYYSSGSWAYPKINSEPPYQSYPTNSPTALFWLGSDDPENPYYGGILLSASLYDNLNKDNLYYVIPEYLRDDSSNDPYLLFVDMVGQHYDNIWIYYKDVSEKYNADNRLDFGVSKDLVADAIRDFGIRLYQNNFSTQDLYTAFLGLTPDGALFPFPNITGSLPTPTGFEYVDTLISASNDYIPLDDVNKSLYKRIYHNLPYLLKSKGTLPGLRALITSYGIPDTILRIYEYGGKDKVQNNDWDWWQNEFNYAFCTVGENFISSSWSLNTDWNSPDDVPATLMFRFKTNGLPKTNIPYSQSLWYATDGLSASGSSLTLTYTGSAYNSGSYSGSIIDPYYQFAHLTFYPNTGNALVSASVYLPFFDGGWWSVMVNRSGSNFTLYTGDKIYEGGDNGTQIGFFKSSSINAPATNWAGALTSYFPVSFSISSSGGVYDVGSYDVALYDGLSGTSSIYTPFSGCYQEIRYYSSIVQENNFKNYLMNPYSIEGNSLLSTPDELAFRAAVAGELYQENISIHPKVTGSWVTTQSFTSDSTFFYDSTPEYFPNTEYFFLNQPVIGIKNIVSDKIRLENDALPSGSVLSPLRALSQTTEVSASYTPNINYLEVSFSPQNEINEDIVAQLGYFNIGDYIGDPAFRSSPLQSYPDLNSIRDYYFQKYIKNYDLVDFIRLIKFFDNSLFKMIKDFVPARTSLASGVVIKQHLLERNRYPQPQVDPYSTIAYTTSGSNNNIPFIYQDISISGTLNPTWNDYNPGTVENFSGGTGGSFEIFNGTSTSPSGSEGLGPNNIFGITQSWYETYQTISGSVTILHDSQEEFYDGEFSGSVILVTTQSLGQPYPLTFQSFNYRPVHYYGTSYSEQNIFLNRFLNPVTTPQPGEILFFNKSKNTPPNAFSPFRDTQFIKIAKEDCSGSNHSNILGDITLIHVYNPLSGNYKQYNITDINEYPAYYLYETSLPESYFPPLYPNQVFNYYTSASNVTAASISPTPVTYVLYGTVAGNTLGYFDATSGLFTLNNTPNTMLSVTASTIITGGSGKFDIALLRQGTISTLESGLYSAGVPLTISSSYYGLQGDQLYLRASRGSGTPVLASGSFIITQSRAISASTCESVIFEPYITTPNFYNSDQNAIINNADFSRLSTTYQDVDYTPGILTPTNFNLLISGSATRAAVQDSNYTLKRHIIPRYEGCKSTSQQLNTWSPPNTIIGYQDEGTYGKVPTVENLKIWVAYAETIGGYTPDRMGCSGVVIKYLIDQNGNVALPNTTENSLYHTQGTFLTNERIRIDSNTLGSGETQYRNIFKGGYRIEPILYTQIGHTPPLWTSSIQLYNENSPTLITDNTANAVLIPNISDPYAQDILDTEIQIGNLGFSNGWNILFDPGNNFSGYEYNVDNDTINEGVNLIINAQFIIENTHSNPIQITITPYKNQSPGDLLSPPEIYTINPNTIETINLNYNLTPQVDFISTDEFYFTIKRNNPPVGSGILSIRANESYFKVTQYPLPNPLPVITVNTNSIWDYPTSSFYTQYSSSQNGVIYIPDLSSSLNIYYNTPGITQEDVSGSGFQPITLDWGVKIGDEFRFEGREDRTYMVKKVFSPQDQSSERISNTGSVEVHLNSALPSSSINLDHFLIRRYIADASAIIFEGLKPGNAPGPYIITPEYIVPELNKNIDQFIVDLTQKGLL